MNKCARVVQGYIYIALFCAHVRETRHLFLLLEVSLTRRVVFMVTGQKLFSCNRKQFCPALLRATIGVRISCPIFFQKPPRCMIPLWRKSMLEPQPLSDRRPFVAYLNSRIPLAAVVFVRDAQRLSCMFLQCWT